MNKYKLKLTDSFSGASDTRIVNCNTEQINQLQKIMEKKQVISHFEKSSQIRWDWLINSIEPIQN